MLTVIFFIITVSFLVFIYKYNENFIVETGKDPLSYPQMKSTSSNGNGNGNSEENPLLLSGYSFYNSQNKIENLVNKKSNILAYNDDIKYENHVIKSKNVEIDRNIISMLEKLKDVIIDQSLPNINQNTVNIPQEEFSHNVENIDHKEVEYIVNKFIKYLNKTTKYNFSLLEINKTVLKMSNNNSIIKNFTVSFFIYEKNISYTKRLRCYFTTKQYEYKNGDVILNSVFIPKDATLESKPLLPPAREPINLNTISDSDINYNIKNNTPGTPDTVLLPLTSAEQESLINSKNNLSVKYSCFGTLQSDLITNKEECLNYGGVWDKPVNTNTPELCPFYRANKNYINDRGGAMFGKCEMPSGILIDGYRYYYQDPSKSKALCYNCNKDLVGQGTLGYCCDEQKTDKINYPGINSPDYKFPGDQLDRYNSRLELQSKGLSVK